jgi:pimeloyl-ACP methyl ester carboxylesterase
MSAASDKQVGATAVRPFRVEIPQLEVDELRRRIAATRWPEKETVDDGCQGTPLARLQELVRYWGTGYDCRRLEARLNALPQFVTSLDGLGIHFIHVRSPHPEALPLIMTHGRAYFTERSPTKDEVLDDITLYWLTNTGTSAGRIYWENGGANPNSAAAQRTTEISVPVAITVFPGESHQAPRSWAERAYPNLIHFNEVDRGGHFAAWEEPELFSEEFRAAFRSLR